MGLLAESCTSLLHIVLPPSCLSCGRPLHDRPSRLALCPECRSALTVLVEQPACRHCGHTVGPFGACAACADQTPAFAAAVRIGPYDGPLAQLVRTVKFREGHFAVPLLAELLAAKLHQAGVTEELDVVAPVPLHWWRHYRRGYNQSNLLAAALRRRGVGARVERVLVRTRNTRPQVGLSRQARQDNVRGAFRARRPEAVRGRRVLLIDDVMTTGATLGACARVLREAGAGSVIVAVAAVAEGRGWQDSR